MYEKFSVKWMLKRAYIFQQFFINTAYQNLRNRIDCVKLIELKTLSSIPMII